MIDIRTIIVSYLTTNLVCEMVVVISDDGQGLELEGAPGAEQKHFGLNIMRERAEQAVTYLHQVDESGRKKFAGLAH